MVGKGATSLVYQVDGHPQFVIKSPSRSSEAHHIAREVLRLQQLPKLAVVNSAVAYVPPRALMMNLYPVHVPYMTQQHILRFKEDVSAALQLLHILNIVHADVHLDNVMVRERPASYVLIDMGGSAGECIYPISQEFGSPGRGGEISIGHLMNFMILLGERCGAQPAWPRMLFPGGSWMETAVDAKIVVQAGLWTVNTQTTEFLDPSDQRGNQDGVFIYEPAQADPTNSDSWEQSAAFAKFYLSCGLRTKGSHIRRVYMGVYPFLKYGNQDG
ncbi:unnamed protein product [Symbiodinium sp. CCMP2456]|nr:unnamed protein product [Symbiodinium sp. CCMP2456]